MTRPAGVEFLMVAGALVSRVGESGPVVARVGEPGAVVSWAGESGALVPWAVVSWAGELGALVSSAVVSGAAVHRAEITRTAVSPPGASGPAGSRTGTFSQAGSRAGAIHTAVSRTGVASPAGSWAGAVRTAVSRTGTSSQAGSRAGAVRTVVARIGISGPAKFQAGVFRSVVFWGVESSGPVRDPGRGPLRVRTVLLNPYSEAGSVVVDEHVRVSLPAGRRWAALGDVLVGPGAGATRAAETALSHPGALVVAVHHGRRCWLRLGPDGTVLELEAHGPGQPAEIWGTLASLAHAWLVAGLPAAEFGSARLCLLRGHVSDVPPASRRSRRLADSASSDCERPTEE